MTLERRDNDAGYCKENCEWAPRSIQANNRRDNVRVEFKGRTQTLEQWCRELGLDRSTIYNRVKRGTCASYEEAFTQPLQKRDITFDGRTQSLAQWAREMGIGAETISMRVKAGWSYEKALTVPVFKQFRNKRTKEATPDVEGV